MKRFQSLKAIRIATLLFPPLALVLLWRSSEVTMRRKIVGTFYIPIFAILYVATILFFLYFELGIDFLEWRGGYIPAITFSKTVPDYARLERSRAEQPKSPSTTNTNTSAKPYWTGFRGPNCDGVYAQAPIATNWPKEGLPKIWRQPIGGGYSSFSIAENRVYTIEQRRDDEVVTAYDVPTGREVWAHKWQAKFGESIGGEGPRATPTYSDGKIYALGGRGEFRCLESATGKLVWKHDIIIENAGEVLTYGIAASPLVVDDKVIVTTGGAKERSVIAYNKNTGAVIWHSQSGTESYTSPTLVTLAGHTQILNVSYSKVMGLATNDGKLLWEYPWRVLSEQTPIAQPILCGTNRIVMSGGYGTGCMALEIGSTGDALSPRMLWKNKNLKNKFTSSVFWSGFIYGLDEDILVCLDANTGERKWKDGRYGYGQVLLAVNPQTHDAHLIVLTGSGELTLVKADPEKFHELAKFQAIEGKTWNYPAIADGKIFVRNAAEMACYDIAPHDAK
ncbi:MAG: WD40-like repeat-like protein [Verrucomicrobiales bacterium]|nr:WD40-like repeat-like protein [Verrucomicrobiales bacterium]